MSAGFGTARWACHLRDSTGRLGAIGSAAWSGLPDRVCTQSHHNRRISTQSIPTACRGTRVVRLGDWDRLHPWEDELHSEVAFPSTDGSGDGDEATNVGEFTAIYFLFRFQWI